MDKLIKLFTIGFAGKSAETFFDLLRQHNIRNVIDVRLSNRSQLAVTPRVNNIAHAAIYGPSCYDLLTRGEEYITFTPWVLRGVRISTNPPTQG